MSDTATFTKIETRMLNTIKDKGFTKFHNSLIKVIEHASLNSNDKEEKEKCKCFLHFIRADVNFNHKIDLVNAEVIKEIDETKLLDSFNYELETLNKGKVIYLKALNKSTLLIYKWQFNLLTGFEKFLFEVIIHADMENLIKLGRVYPAHVNAFIEFSTGEGDWWMEQQTEIVRLYKLQYPEEKKKCSQHQLSKQKYPRMR